MSRFKVFLAITKQYSTKTKVIPDENVLNAINNNVYKPRNHPGILKPRIVSLPKSFLSAVEAVTADYSVKHIIEDGKSLRQHLQAKHPPVEGNELKDITNKAKEKVVNSLRNQAPRSESEEDQNRFKQLLDRKLANVLKKDVYNWQPVTYDNYKALVYLMARAAAEYAALIKIFTEIADRDKDFKPRSLFDFGSGVGTATWAATEFWKPYIFEYYNVDSSSEMNDLAFTLLKQARGTNEVSMRGVYYRQFLPATHPSYDLVVCAYSLLELPSRQSRLKTLLNLWNKTGRYLVLVELGSNSGFHLINEAKDFILGLKNRDVPGHVFSPCPHDSYCPRFVANDGTPCNFEIQYNSMGIQEPCRRRVERYSYVVLEKGERDSEKDLQWPRVVRPNLVKSRHSICRVCTKNGKLNEVIFTAAKHGKQVYHCARSTRWGDLLPVQLETEENCE